MTTQMTDYRLEIDDKDFKAECYFPGISYADFDRAGNLSLWSISRIFEAGRAIPFRQGNFLDFTELLSAGKFSFFVLGGDYYFDPCLWEMARSYQYFPYKITIELINIGQTSITIREVLTNLLDQKELASFIGKIVFVDTTSKRPQPFPSWHLKKYERVRSQEGIQLDGSATSIPGNAYSTKLVVMASDTDQNGHTNQGSYIRFCLDATDSARRMKYLHHITSDVCLYPIVKMSTAYRGETLVGDELIISVWENDLNASMLHYGVSRGKAVAFVATITFRESPSAKL